MNTASNIGIQLTLKGAEQVKQGLKTISVSAAEMARQFDASRSAILTTAAAVATATGIMVDRVSTAAAEIERFAMLAGSTPQEFQRMAAGAKSAGMDMEKYASVMKDTQDKIGDFLQTGGGELKDFFEKIAPAVGVTAEQFKNLSGPQALQLFYNSLQKANLSQKETVFWMESIADDATTLVPLLQNNGAAFDALADRAAKYGAVLSDYALAASKDFKGQTDEMTLALQGAEQILAVGLMPTLTETARELLATADSAGIADTAATVIRTTLEALVIVASDVAFTFTSVGREIGGMAAQAQAFLSLDFARAGQIRAMMKEDAAGARAELEAFQARLLNAGQTAKDVFNLSGVMKANKAGTAEYQAALGALIRMKDDGTVSASQFTAAIKGATAANVSAAAAAGRTGKSLSGMGVGADDAKKAADKAKAAAEQIASAYATTWGNAAKLLRDVTAEEQNLNAAEKALADVMAGDHWVKFTAAQQAAAKAIYDRASAAIEARKIEEADAKWASESADANANVAESAYEAANAAEAQRDAQLQANAAIGLTALEVANLEAARIDDTAAEKQRLAAIMEGIDPAIAADYRRQAQALTELAEAKRDGAVKDAMVESAKEAADEWKRTADKIEDALIDALMDGGKSGAEYIEGLFRSMVLRPVIQAIVSPVAGAVTTALGFSGPPTYGGGSGSGLSTINSGYQALTASGNASLAFTDFGTYATNAVYSAGGSLTNAGFETLGSNVTSAANSLSKFSSQITTAGDALSYLNAASLAADGRWGAAAGSAVGTYFGGPIGGTIGQNVGDLADQFFAGDAGTMHTGGAGGYSAARGAFRTNETLAAGDWWNNGYDKTAGGIKGAQELSKILATTLDTAATTFGQKAGYEVWTGFADDASSDPAWSRLFISNLEGVLVQTDKKFADGEKGQAEYAQYLADATRGVLESMDLPGWADAMLEGLGDTPTVEQLTQAVAYFADVQAALTNLGDYMPQLANLSEEAASQMIRFFGGAENMVAASSAYYQNFYTEAERADVATRQLTAALASIGVDAMPASREAFRDLVEAQDLTTESGLATYAGLIGLSNAFAELVPDAEAAATATEEAAQAAETVEQAYQRLTNVTLTAEQVASQRIDLEDQLLQLQGDTAAIRASELASIDPSNRALQQMIWTLEDAKVATADALQAVEKSISKEKDLVQKASDERMKVLQSQLAAAQKLSGVEQVALQMLGNTTMLRERELAAMDSASAALQNMVWAVEDASNSMDRALAKVQRSINAERERITTTAQDQIKAIEAEIDARQQSIADAQKSVSDLQGVFDGITDAVKTLRGNVLTEQQNLEQARAYIDMSLSVARAGGDVNQERLQAAMQTVVGDSADLYTSGAEYRYQQARQANMLDALGGIIGGRVGSAQTQLEALNSANTLAQDQIKAINEARDAQIKSLDAQLKAAEDAVAAVKGADLSVVAVGESLTELGDSIENYEYARDTLARQSLQTGFDMVQSIEDSIENEKASTAAMLVVLDNQLLEAQNQVAAINGVKTSVLSVEEAISGLAFAISNQQSASTAAEQTLVPVDDDALPSFDVGTNYVPRDMVAKIHQGEAIVPREFNPAIFNPGNASNGELVKLVAALTEEVKRLQGIVQEGNREQRRTANAVNGQSEAPMLVEAV